jgi:hypothetical protein
MASAQAAYEYARDRGWTRVISTTYTLSPPRLSHLSMSQLPTPLRVESNPNPLHDCSNPPIRRRSGTLCIRGLPQVYTVQGGSAYDPFIFRTHFLSLKVWNAACTHWD